MGWVRWGQKRVVRTSQSSWYDHTFYEVPVVGPIDCGKIQSALSRLYPPQFTRFGGFCTIGDVNESATSHEHVVVELVYHIGD